MFSVQGEKPDRLILQGGQIIGAEINGKFELVGGMLGKRPREDAEMASAQAAADAAQAAREAMIAADAPGLPPAAREALREAAERAVRVADELAYAAGLAAQAGGAAAGGGGGGGGGAARKVIDLERLIDIGEGRQMYPFFDEEGGRALRQTSAFLRGSDARYGVLRAAKGERAFAKSPNPFFGTPLEGKMKEILKQDLFRLKVNRSNFDETDDRVSQFARWRHAPPPDGYESFHEITVPRDRYYEILHSLEDLGYERRGNLGNFFISL